MIHSMTAFGRSTKENDRLAVAVEIRSVNNRYLDCNVRVSREFSYLEERIKNAVTTAGITRGKVDVSVTVQSKVAADAAIALNDSYLRGYLAALRRLQTEYGLPDDISVMTVAQNPAVFQIQKTAPDEEADWCALSPAVQEALAMFKAARDAEGERLAADLCGKAEGVRLLVEEIENLSAQDVRSHREKLQERIRGVLAENHAVVDENLLLTECAIYADRVSIDEELVRLRSHLEVFRTMMKEGGPVGRRLDFLLQEINREINTIGSKCIHAAIAQTVVRAKNELEKIREQVQNLE